MFNGCAFFWGQTHLFVYDVIDETSNKVQPPPNVSKPRQFGLADNFVYFTQTHFTSFWVCIFVDSVRWDLVHKVDCASLANIYLDVFISHNNTYAFVPYGFHPLNHELFLVGWEKGKLVYHTSTRKYS